MERSSYRQLVKENNGKGIFQYITAINELKWDKYFSVEELDTQYTYFRGSKLCSGYIMEMLEDGKSVDDIMKECAGIITSAFMNKWSQLFNVNVIGEDSSIDGSSDYYESITEDIVDDGESTRTANSERIGKVSAYNDDDFVNDDSETTTDKDTTTNDNVRKRSYLRQGSQNRISAAKNTFDYLQKNYIYDIIFTDVDSIMTIAIY